MPWIHLHVGNEGYVKACCVANINYGNINTQSLDEIWNGEPINKLREQFKQGIPDNRCAVCINLEKSGGKSIRQETFEKYPATDTKTIALPKYFDIRFSNICNFRCRTCWHGASSRWFDEAKVLKNNSGEEAIINNIKDFNSFIANCGDALLQAEEIYFAGGEPLVTEEHYLLLHWLIKNNVTNVRLRYNTNFSVLKFKNHDVIELWKKFSSIEILASIDASEELGEYIRKEMNWKKVLKNREAIRTLPHIKFKIAPTVSVFNIKHIPYLYQSLLENNFIEAEDIYINILERPFHFNIKALPQEQKKTILQEHYIFFDWLNTKNISIKGKFQEYLDFMNSEDKSNLWPKFISETTKLDLMRGENFEEYWFVGQKTNKG